MPLALPRSWRAGKGAACLRAVRPPPRAVLHPHVRRSPRSHGHSGLRPRALPLPAVPERAVEEAGSVPPTVKSNGTGDLQPHPAAPALSRPDRRAGRHSGRRPPARPVPRVRPLRTLSAKAQTTRGGEHPMKNVIRFGFATGLAAALALFGVAQAQQGTSTGPAGSGTGSGTPDSVGKGDTGRTGSSASSGSSASDRRRRRRRAARRSRPPQAARGPAPARPRARRSTRSCRSGSRRSTPRTRPSCRWRSSGRRTPSRPT